MEWIRIEYQLPEEGKTVFITNGKYMTEGELLKNIDPDDDPTIYFIASSGGLWEDITHWMPLPELPKD